LSYYLEQTSHRYFSNILLCFKTKKRIILVCYSWKEPTFHIRVLCAIRNEKKVRVNTHDDNIILLLLLSLLYRDRKRSVSGLWRVRCPSVRTWRLFCHCRRKIYHKCIYIYHYIETGRYRTGFEDWRRNRVNRSHTNTHTHIYIYITLRTKRKG